MSYTLQNFYKSTLSLDWSTGTGTFYVTTKPTISTGWLVTSPNNSTTREIIKYTSTGTDTNGDYVVVSERGVGGTTEQTHTVGEPIRMNITAEYWDAMNDDIAAIVASGVSNANTTTMGGVEIATDAEVDAGTATGGTGASIVLTPANVNASHNIPFVAPGTSGNVMSSNGTDWTSTVVATRQHTIGAQDNALVKTYFNIQLPFTLWTGSTSGAATTDFVNWVRTSSDAFVSRLGTYLDFQGTANDSIYMIDILPKGNSDALAFDDTNIVILDWWAKLPASGTGDVNMGFAQSTSITNTFEGVYNDTSGNGDKVTFSQSSAGTLYAVCGGETGGAVTATDISSGVTVTNWNNYRIELDLGTSAKFYINGTLKTTITTNLYTGVGKVGIGFGRSNTSLFQITAPTLSLEMNP